MEWIINGFCLFLGAMLAKVVILVAAFIILALMVVADSWWNRRG